MENLLLNGKKVFMSRFLTKASVINDDSEFFLVLCQLIFLLELGHIAF